MTAKRLADAMRRVATWPEAAQEELDAIALEIDAALHGGVFRATNGELAGIDRGTRAADAGRLATPEDVAGVLARHRPA